MSSTSPSQPVDSSPPPTAPPAAPSADTPPPQPSTNSSPPPSPQPNANPPDQVAAPSSAPTSPPPPPLPAAHLASSPSPPPPSSPPPRSSNTHEIVSADTPNSPDHAAPSSVPTSPPPRSPPPPLPEADLASPPPSPSPPPPPPPRSSSTHEIVNADTPNSPDRSTVLTQPTHETNYKRETSSNKWRPIRSLFKKLRLLATNKNTTTSTDEDDKDDIMSATSLSFVNEEDSRQEVHNLLEKLHHMQGDLKKLQQFEGDLANSMRILQDRLETMNTDTTQTSRKEILEANRDIMMLNSHIPSVHKLSLPKSTALEYWQTRNSRINAAGLPNLDLNERFRQSAVFKEYQELYEQLSAEQKLCLLCFAVFPENQVIKKRLLLYWWVGEGFLESSSDDNKKKPVENVAEEVFKILTEKGLVEPVQKKQGLAAAQAFKMHPVVRSAVVILAKRDGFFDYDQEGNPTANSIMCNRACLVQGDGRDLDKVRELDPENLETLFNVSKNILEFSLEWFSKMKKVNVLYLGRWQRSPKHHIEVESTEFLDGFKNMSRLRFLSLQGMSRIFELPKSLSMLTNLRILDLRACHNLETLPKGIGLLKKLVHLDLSECYMLDRVPKEIASLSELQVLKGFVVCRVKIENSCSVRDLAELKKLRKLSIHSNRKDFPKPDELSALNNIEKLTKLKIVWGHEFKLWSEEPKGETPAVLKRIATKIQAETRSPIRDDIASSSKNVGLLSKLEKLDLQCFPHKVTPTWLVPVNLRSLKKLYIKGGELGKLVPVHRDDPNKWEVEVLCLKFLSEFRMDWRDLEESFPKMYYLEKVKCPNLNLFPCDENGVWLNKMIKKIGSKTLATTTI